VTLRNGDKRALTDLQQAILDLIWARGSATAEQVRSGLKAKPPLKDSTVRTLLRRLEARGYLTHHLDGKVFVYEAAVPAQSVAAGAVRQIIKRFWAGSAEQFLAGMVDEKVLSVEEIQKLARRVKKARSREGA
jgi:BlaI family transcriptional regulator, penicillinase repressor